MISSLDDAWAWYQCVRTLARDMDRLGERFWNRQEWAEALGRDNRFRSVRAIDLQDSAKTISDDLDDLAVLLLLSVLEAMVRDQARIDVENSLPTRLHPAVEHAVEVLKKDIGVGSFGKVTRAFRGIDPNLVEEVNQVRRYRNRVAHGRRGPEPDSVTPEKAYDRLTRFLKRMDEVAIVTAEGSDAS